MATKKKRARASKPQPRDKYGRFIKRTDKYSSVIKKKKKDEKTPRSPRKKPTDRVHVSGRGKRIVPKSKGKRKSKAKKSKNIRRRPGAVFKANTGNPALDRLARQSFELSILGHSTAEEILRFYGQLDLDALGISEDDAQVLWDHAINKLHHRGFSNEQILALYRNISDFFVNRISGRDYQGWRQLLDMIEQDDERFERYMELADLLDIDESDARDEWFSPTVE